MSKQKSDSSVLEVAQLLSDCSSPKKIMMFLTLFLTESELQTLSKRVQIFHLLSQKTAYEQIQAKLGVSSATVSAVAQLHKHPFSEEIIRYSAARTWATRTAGMLRDWFSPLFS